MKYDYATAITLLREYALPSTGRNQPKTPTYSMASEQSQLSFHFHYGQVAMLNRPTFIHQHHIAFLNLATNPSLVGNLDKEALWWNITKA